MQRFRWLALAAAATISLCLTSIPADAARTGPPAARTTAAPAPRSAVGPVTLGRVAPTGSSACLVNFLWYQAFQDPDKAPYRVPYDGVVTSVSHFASGVSGRIQAAFIAPAGTDFVYNVTQRSAKLTLTPNQLNTFAVRMPVHAGEILTLRTVDPNLRCIAPGGTIDQITAEEVLDGETTFGPPTVSQLHQFVNISAVLEPDVDGDGYGDASQDGCPQLAAVHDPCPAPVVRITKAPAKRVAGPRVRIKFTANLAGSAFGCSVDGRAFKPCHSPFKSKLLTGTHTVRIQATSPVGVAGDPVTVQFKVKPKRPRG
ncbi:MAG TPA: hypothetical protein VFV89_10365 [Nocardioides sp.]|uniref:hypothetical protein n=1 Tax=Nocardioides sp. TaxID=35761 RepID=UPI002E335AD6|nr:hypothetical protein [Nocardioides sp.]HEX5088202.1 hypothetical protein [Nocardioides sp.]